MLQSTDEEKVGEINPIEMIDIKVESEEFFHTDDEEIVDEINPIEQTNIKVEPEECFLMNDVKGNYDGETWMIIFVDLLSIFY